jgi:6-phospho-beta-glucosidase
VRKSIKVAVLGGSGVYTPGLIIAIVNRIDELPEVNIVLSGRTVDKLETVYLTSTQIVKNTKGKIKVERTIETEKGLEGSDIIINQIRAGGFSARARDEALAEELGVVEEETMGIVGLANALRTIPIVLRYAKLVEKYCPEAWFLNFTNPASMVMRAMKQKTKLKVFGVCDLPEVLSHTISESIGEKRHNLFIDYAGINHLGWVTDVIKEGKSIFDRVLEKSGDFKKLGVDPEVIRITEAVPSPFLKYYYHPDKQIEKAKKRGMTRGEELKELEGEFLKAYSDEKFRMDIERVKALLFRKRYPVWYEYGVVPVLISLFGKAHNTHIIIHKNNGSVDVLEDDDIVETSTFIDQNGIKPISGGVIPVTGMGLLKSVACYERLSVYAVFHPSEDTLLKALLCHPLVPSYSVARASLPYLMKQVQGK